MAKQSPVIVWFRDDLRLADHPALTTAVKAGAPLVCLYVLDEESRGIRPHGGASRWWLAQSLRALAASLHEHGHALVLRRGKAADVVPHLADEVDAAAVHANRRYDQAGVASDNAVAASLEKKGRAWKTHAGNLLAEPGTLRTASGEPIKIYSAFWKHLRQAKMREPLRAPQALAAAGKTRVKSDPLDSWGLEPTKPDWAGGLRKTWTPGEATARAHLRAFAFDALADYAGARDRVDHDATSRLSPHLRFGEISAAQVWTVCPFAADHPKERRIAPHAVEKFLSELSWREFAYHTWAENPHLATQNLRDQFDDFPWRHDTKALHAWQKGQTGYPLVDAGMRQLWETGWLPNRVRMVAASLLTKHLLIDWRQGERWFWDTLVDADPANNPFNWQWVAGTGIDSAPYFRIFNPMLQSEKFDPAGDYIRAQCPELESLSDRLVHRPWEADADTNGQRSSDKASGKMSKPYPSPIVDYDAGRKRALAAYDKLKKSSH
ncbi:MAG TPA: deoxyribodipyrimidine photo-lyase [Xanthobacteraceae bacterium]|jgi:deoxyribodipyrimidine photo-lyase|nr:deoxyribodipyrimidine photo-lyase [Xanthobacteraceae bacterium]